MYSYKKIKTTEQSEKGWYLRAIYLASGYIVKDFFLISNYRTCIQYSSDYYKSQNNIIDYLENEKGEEVSYKESLLASAKELSEWTEEMKNEEYHELYLHSFIGIWSSFEAGIENCFSDYIENDSSVAANILSKFKKQQYKIEE